MHELNAAALPVSVYTMQFCLGDEVKQQLELCADVILLLEEQCDSRLHIPSSGSPTLLILGSSFNNCMHRIISVFVLQAMVTVAWYPAPFFARAVDEATV